MFGNFDTLIAEMESNNLALEALLADMSADESQMDPATEGLFSKPKTLDEMLANVKKTIDKKCKTSEDCDDWLAKIKGEEEKFNTAIKNLQEATKKYQEDGDKKALKATCKPILKNLKKTCNILSMKDISDDAENITEDELKKLRDFLVGAKKIISDKAAELSDGGCGDGGECAEEGCGGSCESFLAMLQGCDGSDQATQSDIATEALGGFRTSMANWFDKMASKAQTHANKLKYNTKNQGKKAKLDKDGNVIPERDTSNSKFIAVWEGIAKFCQNWAKRLRQWVNKSMDKEREAAEQKAAQAAMDKVKDDVSKQEAAEGTPANESLLYDMIDEEIAVESAYTYYQATQSDIATESEVGEAVAGAAIGAIISLIANGIAKANDPDDKQRKNIQLGQISKQITATIKDAKKAARHKDYDQAIALYNKAIKGYQGLLSMAKKIPDRTVHGGKYADGSDTVKSASKVDAINWCNSKISGCQAAIQKIKDKKSKADNKAAKKAAKAATEGYTDVDDALESLLTELNEPAMESFDDEDPLAGLDEALSEE